ncbi:hypothetical protein ACWC5I_37545 [Kitasatospora sp. NPDC001574]
MITYEEHRLLSLADDGRWTELLGAYRQARSAAIALDGRAGYGGHDGYDGYDDRGGCESCGSCDGPGGYGAHAAGATAVSSTHRKLASMEDNISSMEALRLG